MAARDASPPAKRRRRGVVPEKSPNDKFSYRWLAYENGVEVLLVSSDDAKKGRAACACAVQAGSFNDPASCQGLAHYLEHMLFMGSEKYPGEDEMEAFLSKHGGSSNAFTDCARTCYFFDVNKTELHRAVDLLAQFFTAPLLNSDAADRELEAIESEFRITQNSDDSRLDALLAQFACWPFHNFSWGNLQSLKVEPEKNGVKVHQELRKFFQQHYQAPRLRVCLFGVETLDSLESAAQPFASLPSGPDLSVSGPPEVSMPFEASMLPCLLRMRPVQELRKLHFSWQVPPSQEDYLSQPLNYLGHLVGHEGAGSLQSFLKRRGLATDVEAGVGEDEDFSCNRWCSIFSVDITLTELGLTKWMEVAHVMFLYLAMLRREGPQEWVYEELRRAQEMSWRFLEEMDPMEYVQKLACEMLPDLKRAPEHLLKAEWMLSRWEPSKITQYLELLCPERCFIILVSAFGNPRPEEKEAQEEEEEEEEDDLAEDPIVDLADPHFDVEAAGPPQRAPHFGTEFWKANQKEVEKLVALCRVEAKDGLAAEALRSLRLPDRNPFFADDLEVRAIEQETGDSVDGWMKTIDVRDLARQRLHAVLPTTTSIPRRPQALTCSCWAWHLQDTVLRTPRSELWLKFSAPNLQGVKEQALLAWLVRVLSDQLNETVYLAEQASLDLQLKDDYYGFDLRAGGFHEKLPELLAEGCRALRRAATAEGWQGEEMVMRCGDQRNELLRHWRNEYLKPDDHCADLRRAVVMPEKYLSTQKAEALKDLSISQLQSFAEVFIPTLHLEVLYQGNVLRSDAEKLIANLPELLGGNSVGKVSGLHAPHPTIHVLEVPHNKPIVWVQDSPDSKNRNVAVELYWQLGRPSSTMEMRETAKVELLSDLLAEPLFDQLRTKQQLGYVASCGARWTHHVQGFSVWLMSAKYAPAEICRRVLEFLEGFQQTLADMSDEDLARHVDALAAAKVEPERTLQSMQQAAWAELQERSHSFDRSWQEALAVLDLQKAEIQDMLRKCTSMSMRRLVVTVAVGGRSKSCAGAAAAEEGLRRLWTDARFVSSAADLRDLTAFDS